MTYSQRLRIFFCFSTALLISCNQSPSAQQPSVQPPPQIETTKSDSDLLKKFQKLQNDFVELQVRLSQLESGEATVSTEELVYGIAKTNFGAFTVTAKSVTPYLDGFKVKLSFGNLTSATFNGAKITASWGIPFDGKNVDAYLKSQKNKEFSVTNSFPSGAFSDVEVILTPAMPEEVKSLSVGLQLDQLAMRVR
ncbi:MAG: hypothetical protein JWR16_665 [Nevskia sp.]|nr:hypothetical protein [Nevskia sp.]